MSWCVHAQTRFERQVRLVYIQSLCFTHLTRRNFNRLGRLTRLTRPWCASVDFECKQDTPNTRTASCRAKYQAFAFRVNTSRTWSVGRIFYVHNMFGVNTPFLPKYFYFNFNFIVSRALSIKQLCTKKKDRNTLIFLLILIINISIKLC